MAGADDDRKNGALESEDTIVASVAGSGVEPRGIAGVPSSSLLPSQSDPGTIVAGRYRILSLLGEGGMGTVYRVHDAELDEAVAMKVIHAHLASEPGLVDRFRQEVKLARRVTHPHVARVFDIGEDRGEKFFTMEYVEGESLADLVTREAPLSVSRAVELLCAIGRGLDAAHAAGIVHRDLKPENVLLGKDGRVLITDFGIARAFDGGSRSMADGGMVGTPAYMAPEQVEARSDIDARADVYALGEIAYELLTGELPWQGATAMAIAVARLEKPPPDPLALRPTMPAAIALVVTKAMARDRADRYARAADVVAALERGLTTITTTTPPRPSRPPAPIVDERGLGVVVLPFRNDGPPEDAYIAEGIAAELVDALSMTSRLHVKPYRVAAAHADEGDPVAIGRALGVQAVVTGSVRRVGDGFRLSARGISVAQGFQLWAHRFECKSGDLFAMSDEIAHAVALALTTPMTVPVRRATNGTAIELYLRGRAMMREAWFSVDDLGPAYDTIARAHALAPDDPTITAALATVKVRRAFLPLRDTPIADELREARALAERVVAEASHIGEAWVALANVHWMANDPVRELAALRGALEASPYLAHAHDRLGRLFLEAAFVEPAVERLKAASAMDPSMTEPRWELARALAFRGRWDECDALFALPVDGVTASTMHGMLSVRFCMWRRGPGNPDPTAQAKPVPHPDDSVPTRLQRLALSALRGSFDDGILALLEELLRGVPPGWRATSLLRQLAAESLLFAGDPRAFDWLVAAVDAGLGDLAWMEYCPLLAPARSDPRFAELHTRVAERMAPVRAAARELGLVD